jgi:hypothetical protein
LVTRLPPFQTTNQHASGCGKDLSMRKIGGHTGYKAGLAHNGYFQTEDVVLDQLLTAVAHKDIIRVSFYLLTASIMNTTNVTQSGFSVVIGEDHLLSSARREQYSGR